MKKEEIQFADRLSLITLTSFMYAENEVRTNE
jgi:hypothetical protein